MRSPLLSAVPDAEVDAIVREFGVQMETTLEALAERHGVAELGGRLHLIKGIAADLLPELMERLNINLIVMGTVARRGLSGLIMGNTAEAMMRAVRCSILTIKPEGFVSSVSEPSAV